MDIRPIKSHDDYEAALTEIERLMSAPSDTPESDRCDMLATLVEQYEAIHEPVLLPEPIEAILYHMERLGLSEADMGQFLGSETQVHAILNRKQPLTIDMMRRLQTGLGISADVLIQKYHVDAVKAKRLRASFSVSQPNNLANRAGLGISADVLIQKYEVDVVKAKRSSSSIPVSPAHNLANRTAALRPQAGKQYLVDAPRNQRAAVDKAGVKLHERRTRS